MRCEDLFALLGSEGDLKVERREGEETLLAGGVGDRHESQEHLIYQLQGLSRKDINTNIRKARIDDDRRQRDTAWSINSVPLQSPERAGMYRGDPPLPEPRSAVSTPSDWLQSPMRAPSKRRRFGGKDESATFVVTGHESYYTISKSPLPLGERGSIGVGCLLFGDHMFALCPFLHSGISNFKFEEEELTMDVSCWVNCLGETAVGDRRHFWPYGRTAQPQQ